MKLRPVYQWSHRGQMLFICAGFVFGFAVIPLAMIFAKLFFRWFQTW